MRNDPSKNRRSRRMVWGFCLASIAAWSVAQAQDKAKQSTAPASSTNPPKPDPIVAELVEAHNKERAKEGLAPLKLEARLTEAAQVHAKDMADHSMMSHEGSDESTPEQRVIQTGYRYQRTGENVAMGYRDVAEVIQGWMDSPGHRKNILGDYREIGVARVLGKDGKPYWCANFGTPMPQLEPANASKDLIQKINDARAAAKLPVLELDEKLAKAAQDKAVDLARKSSQGGGTATFDGVDQKLYSDLALSTANGHPDAEAMVKVLIEKPDLKAQMLGKFTRIGTGYATAENGVPYWCLILGTPSKSVNNRSRR